MGLQSKAPDIEGVDQECSNKNKLGKRQSPKLHQCHILMHLLGSIFVAALPTLPLRMLQVQIMEFSRVYYLGSIHFVATEPCYENILFTV